MKVKRRMQIMAILPIVLALVTSAILAWMTINMHGIMFRLRATNLITRDVFLLDMVTHEYIKTLTPASLQRWQSIHARLVETMERETVANPLDRQTFNNIHQSLINAKSVFADLTAHIGSGESPFSGNALNLLSRLWEYSQSMLNEALTLATIAHNRSNAIQLASFFLIIGVSSVLAIILTSIAVLVSRRIDKGLAVLGGGTQQISQGKLGYEVWLENQDELGELAAAFNTMSRVLKKDQDTIHAEMATRVKIAESLSKSNIQLSDALTKLKRAQEEVIQQERLKVLKQIAGGILHDIYDAMMPILGSSELMLKYPEEIKNSQHVRDHIKTIHGAVTKAISVARHLSEYFYPTQQKNVAPINLDDLLKNVLSLVLPDWKKESHRIAIKTEFGKISSFNSVEADMNEALTHIITNAVEAIEETGTITLRTRMESDAIVIEISDTGSGMDSKTRLRCLEPFFSTKGHGHSGMGLTITQGAVARCHGSLIIDSVIDKGTTVILRMPIVSATEATKEADLVPSIDRKLRILVADDDADIRKLLMRAIKAMGYEVEMAADGPDAIKLFRSGSFDIVVVDLAMPKMNGNEVAAAIKLSRPSTPVIMLTGFGDVLKQSGEKLDSVDFVLSKPMSLDDLQNAINCVVIQSLGKT